MIYYVSCLLDNHIGTWLSLVEHSVWDRRVAGSNPVTPTIELKKDYFIIGISFANDEVVFFGMNACSSLGSFFGLNLLDTY